MAFLANLAGGTAIGDALIRIGADTRAMRAEMAALNGQTRAQLAQTGQNIERQTNRWGKAFTAVKIGIAGVGLGLGAFAIAGIKAARDFDRAFAQVYSLTNLTTEALADLKAQTLDLAKRVPQAPQELAEGLYYVISSGFEAADAMKVLEVAAMDAAVGMTDTQTVADGLTSAMNAYGAGAEQAAEFSDVMTQAIVQGKAEWADLARAIGPVAVQAASSGVTFKEVAAAIAHMTQIGLTAQRGSRNLAFLIRALEAPNNIAAQTFENLGLKIDDTTLKEMGMIDMLKMMSDAAGEHHDIIIKNADGTTNLAKSLEATEKANKGWANSMRTMTGGAAGFLVAQILLQENGQKYTDILGSMDEAQGLTVESFEKMKEADPGMMFDLLKNRIMVSAIEFGTALMPHLDRFVTWLTEVVPKAFALIGSVWEKYLQEPVGNIIEAFGHLGEAIAGIFGQSSKTEKGASGLRTAIKSIAAGIGAVVDMLAKAINFMGDLFGNPVVQAITRVVVAVTALRLGLSAVMGVAGGLDRRFRGLARFLTGGLLFPDRGPGVAGDPALNASAQNLDQSAAALESAATALKNAAGIGPRGAPPVATPGRYPPIRMVGPVGPASILGAPTPEIQKAALAQSSAAVQAYYRGLAQPLPPAERARHAAGAYNSGLNLLRNTATDVGRGLTRGAGMIRSGISTGFNAARSGISDALGAVSRVFWPAFVATMAAEFVKQPVGQWISSNTPFQRAGAKISEDFLGGLWDLLTKSLAGGDAAVGRSETMQIGNMQFNTLKLAKLGVTNAEFDLLEAPVGTIENAKGSKAVMDRTEDLARLPGEEVEVWYARIVNALAEGVDGANIKAQLDEIFLNAGTGTGKNFDLGGGRGIYQLPPEKHAQLQALLERVTGAQIAALHTETREAYLASVGEALESRGFTTGEISRLTIPQLDVIGDAILADTEGTMGAIQDFLVQQYTGALGKAQPRKINTERIARVTADMVKKFGDDWEAEVKAALRDPDTAASKRLSSWMAKKFGDGWRVLFQDAVELAHPPDSIRDSNTIRALADKFGDDWIGIVRAALANPKSAQNSEVVGVLRDVLGKDWKSLVRSAVDGFIESGGRLGSDAMLLTEMTAGLGELRTNTEVAIRKFWETLPPSWNTALQGFVDTAQTAIDPAILARLKDKFGEDWMIALREGTEAIPEGSAIANELERVFKPNWREALTTFGDLLFQGKGGADSLALKRGIASAISDEIAKLTPDDLNKPDDTRRDRHAGTVTVDALTKPLTAEQEASAKKAIQKVVNRVINDGTLAAAASGDAEAAKAAMEDLSQAFVDVIPDAAQRQAFLDQIVNIERLGTPQTGTSALERIVDQLPPMATWGDRAATTLGNVYGWLQKIANFRVPGAPNAHNRTDPDSPDYRPPTNQWGGGKRDHAMGGRTAWGEASWVGEYGPELRTDIGASNITRTSKVESMLSEMVSGAARAVRQGMTQNLRIENLHLQTAGDVVSTIEALDFLTPAGR